MELRTDWGVKYKHISGFIFHPIFMKGDGGIAVGEIWVYIKCR